jgi:hypothetical protein
MATSSPSGWIRDYDGCWLGVPWHLLTNAERQRLRERKRREDARELHRETEATLAPIRARQQRQRPPRR